MQAPEYVESTIQETEKYIQKSFQELTRTLDYITYLKMNHEACTPMNVDDMLASAKQYLGETHQLIRHMKKYCDEVNPCVHQS